MFEIPRKRPSFSREEAQRIATAEYGIREAKLTEMPGERDQNFHLTCPDGREFVLKISHDEERKENLEFQLQALSHLQRNCPDLSWPQVQPTQSGEYLATARYSEGGTHYIRLATYLPGVPLVRVKPHSPELLHTLGRALGKIDRALEDFEHEGAHRRLQWDLFQSPEVLENYAEFIIDPDLHALVDHYYNRFTTHLLPRLSKLRRSVIHNDANDFNVLVGPPRAADRAVTGIIDMGDMVHTATVFEVAVACTYVMMEKDDPLAVAGWLVAGYHAEYPLHDEELEALYLLICMRLCVSVTLAAFQRRREPNNDYLSISEQPARELLSRLMDVNPNYAHYRFREACGLPPCPRGEKATVWLKENAGRIGKVVEYDLRRELVHRFDLSVGSIELGLCADMTDPATASEIMFRHIREAGARVGIGLYNEARRFYTSPLFQSGEAGEWRTIHIGTDIFVKPFSPVFAPLDGEVHSLQVNPAPLDYGPTIILEHRVPDENLKFYTLYGHLTADSLDGLYAGMSIRQGDQIARVGDRPENGNWPPHLHFQIIADMMDYIGDFPGVAPPSQRRLWLSLAPDPNLILRLPEGCSAKSRYTNEELLVQRRQHLGPNLSLAYRQHLTIVRGVGAYLYDENGQGYLDLVNNVCHVGHCHPRVVAAGQKQMAVLNTNTRYLHEHIVGLAQDLCATLPEPLRVCYFVCSGSEANELALRLAQTHTGQRDIMVLAGGYHGNSGVLVDVSS
ncbi:MAG: aminotransferase class III-fold pyridoxal phosphate-dependent enzyme, partial [Acidobacteria bacterium]|nr:aminotransferase class III-fold pyridoxal phosphate-dependent enzyme [Acidobacteriota bacterium]